MSDVQSHQSTEKLNVHKESNGSNKLFKPVIHASIPTSQTVTKSAGAY